MSSRIARTARTARTANLCPAALSESCCKRDEGTDCCTGERGTGPGQHSSTVLVPGDPSITPRIPLVQLPAFWTTFLGVSWAPSVPGAVMARAEPIPRCQAMCCTAHPPPGTHSEGSSSSKISFQKCFPFFLPLFLSLQAVDRCWDVSPSQPGAGCSPVPQHCR